MSVPTEPPRTQTPDGRAAPPLIAEAPGADALDVPAYAAAHATDPRLAARVPGFDAPFQLAGLAGHSDGAMRVLARRQGCPHCVTEARLDRFVLEDPGAVFDLAGRPEAAEDRPLAVQLIGDAPGSMAAAAAAVVAAGRERGWGPGSLALDVNLACPVRKIARRRRGGHWLADAEGALEILRAVREALPPEVPSTVKLRRGSDDTPAAARRFERVFEGAYDLGYAWAVVHARTVEQQYEGPSRWGLLRELVRRYPDRPILGSGDIWSVEDVFRMLAYTGVTAVSVARGGIGRPWFFAGARALLDGRTGAGADDAARAEALRQHFGLARAIHGEERASLRMRKFGLRAVAGRPGEAEAREAFARVRSAEDWDAAVTLAFAEGPAAAADGAPEREAAA